MTKRQEVALLDEGWNSTKYVAVGLRNAGCSVHIVTAVGEGERPDARFLGPGITCDAAPPVGSERYIEAVGAILSRRPPASILPFTEQILYRIWNAAPVWADRLFPDLQPWQRRLLRDKHFLSEHVANAGVRIPKQHRISMADNTGALTPSSAAITSASVWEFGFPVVVKGTTGCGGARVRIARTAEDALDAAIRLSSAGECFLQEYVAGHTFVVGGVFRRGEPIRIFAFKPIERAHATGPSLRHQSVGDPALIDFALGVFRALDWTGIGFIECIQRPDGKFFFIEFNPRPWGSTGATARAGVDLFSPLAYLLAGDTPAPDLSFRTDKPATMFPQAACARLRKGGIRVLGSLVLEPYLWLHAPWREPGLVAHLARQLWWRWRDGTLQPASATPDADGVERLDDDKGHSLEPSPREVPER